MYRLFVFIASALLIASCSGHKNAGSSAEMTQLDAEKEFVSSLKDSDSLSLVTLSDEFIKKLTSGQVYEAVDMLYVLNDNQVCEKSDSTAKEMTRVLSMFRNCDYTLDYVSFSTQGNNDVCYKLFQGDPDQGVSFKLALNPVLVDGKWYLTLKERNQTGRDLAKTRQLDDNAPAPEKITLHR